MKNWIQRRVSGRNNAMTAAMAAIKPMGSKASRAGHLMVYGQLGQPRWTPRRYDMLAEEGYRRNVIAFRCIKEIAQGAASVPWLLYDRQQELTEHPLLTLLTKPNPAQGQASWLEILYSDLMIAGNAYIEAVGEPGQWPRELWVLRPDRMTVVPGRYGLPEAYEYRVNSQVYRWAADVANGNSPILHLKNFHPLDDWYGLSPMEAAAYAIDQHNEASKWNQALMQNGARPSGALVVQMNKDGDASLSEDQFERLKSQLDEQYSGPTNAGRPMLLEGGLQWVDMMLNPRDLDYLSARNSAAREIALAFGYPPMLLGIPGDNTYNNQREARLALWEQTILPMVHQLRDGLNNWLIQQGGAAAAGLRLDYDPDGISALSLRREQLWDKLNKATFLSEDEKRQAAGYGHHGKGMGVGGGESKFWSPVKYSPDQPRVPAGNPDGGQWTSGDDGESDSGEGDPGSGSDPGAADNKPDPAADTSQLDDGRVEPVYPFEDAIALIPVGQAIRGGIAAIRAAWVAWARSRAAKNWTLGTYKSKERWENQLESRDWTPEQITNTIKKGEKFPAPNKVNPENTATRYQMPGTNRFVVVDDATKEVLQVSENSADFIPNQ